MKQLTDENMLFLIAEFAKVDRKALSLMAELQDAKEFGEKDMALAKMHSYLRDRDRETLRTE